MDVSFRRAGADDVEHIKWALFNALAWSPEREKLVRVVTLDYPEAARYHRDWGRPGDGGVIASADGEIVGVGYYRVFTEEDHGHGYVDERTPELAVAVRDGFRGRGVGTAIMRELAHAAREAGFARLSLSVDAENPARGLYERLGYRELAADESDVRMVLDLAGG